MEKMMTTFLGFSRVEVKKALQGCVLVLVLLLSAACESKAPSGTDAEASNPSGLIVQQARAHLLPGGQGALYFTVESGVADHLLRVETAAATAAEMHETVSENGVMRMVAHPDGFEVSTGEELVFEPGGKHVMLLGFEVVEGAESIALTLHFENIGAVEVDAELIFLAGSAPGSTSPSSVPPSTGGEHHHHGAPESGEGQVVEEEAAT